MIDWHAGDIRESNIVNEDMAGGFIEAAAMALGAGLYRDIPGQFVAHRAGLGFTIAASKIVDDALEGLVFNNRKPAHIAVTHLDCGSAGSIEQQFLLFFCEPVPGGLQVKSIVRSNPAQ